MQLGAVGLADCLKQRRCAHRDALMHASLSKSCNECRNLRWLMMHQ